MKKLALLIATMSIQSFAMMPMFGDLPEINSDGNYPDGTSSIQTINESEPDVSDSDDEQKDKDGETVIDPSVVEQYMDTKSIKTPKTIYKKIENEMKTSTKKVLEEFREKTNAMEINVLTPTITPVELTKINPEDYIIKITD